MARTPLTEREKQLLEEGKRNTALRAAGQPVPPPAPSVSDPNRPADLSGPVEKIGTATRVGDRLYGSATGVTPETVDKAKSYLSTQSALDSAIRNPNATLTDQLKATKANDEAMAAGGLSMVPRDMIDIASGVKMDEKTANRYASNQAYQTFLARPTGPDYAKANAAIQRMVDTKRDRDTRGGVAFEQGRKDWDQWRQSREDDRMIAQKAQQEMSAANRKFADAQTARNSILKQARAGRLENPDLLEKANRRLNEATQGRGYGTLNVEEQRYVFEDKIREREGLPLSAPSLRRRRFNPYSVGSGPMISSRTPGGVGG